MEYASICQGCYADDIVDLTVQQGDPVSFSVVRKAAFCADVFVEDIAL
jgi:hypothetical protein